MDLAIEMCRWERRGNASNVSPRCSIGSIVVAIWSGANEINEEGCRNAVWDHKESISEKRLEVLTCCVFWERGPW